MKKLITSNIVENVRSLGTVKAIFIHMENAYIDALAEVMKGLLAGTTTPVAVHGCVNSGSGSDYDISAGAIWHNGEMFSIAAFVGTAPGGQVPVLALQTSVVQLAYTDNTNQDTLSTRTYAWQFGASGSGLGDFSALGRLGTIINNSTLDVDAQILAVKNEILNGAGPAFDTLLELAAALGNDPNFATTMTTALAGKAPLASPALTGNPTAPTQVVTDDSTKIATTEHVKLVTAGLLRKVVNIGDWNMDSTNAVTVAHGLTLSKIISVSVIIRNDDDSQRFHLEKQDTVSIGDISGWVSKIDSDTVDLARTSTGNFDHADFDSTSYNRGFVVIDHLP